MANLKTNYYPFYDSFNKTGKDIYDLLLTEINKANTTIRTYIKCKSTDVFAAMKGIYYDHPELFWYTGKGSCTTRNGYVETITIEYNNLAISLDYHKNEFQKAVEEFLNASKGKTLLEQEKILHDKMVNEVTYVHNKYDQTAYASLVAKKAVCAGYSRGFQYLMQRIGLPCYYVSGVALNKKTLKSEGHAWNIIKLGPDYYNMDITWDDCFDNISDNISYMYYNCTDQQISADHKRDKEFQFLPKCIGTKYSFKNIYKRSPELERIIQDGVTCQTVVDSKETFKKTLIPELKKTNKVSISFPSNSSNVLKGYPDWIKETIIAVYGNRVGWKYDSSYVDYKNGWYKISINVLIKR